jgi:hypothetical protein
VKWFSVLQPELDPKYQLITQPPPGYDGGDTAQREGSFALCIALLHDIDQCDGMELLVMADRYANVLALLNDPNHPGWLRRWPDPTSWAGMSNRFSRDQAIPNVIAMGELAKKPALIRFMKNHLRRALLFATNTRENGVMPAAVTLNLLQRIQFCFGWRPSQPTYAWAPPDITTLGFWSLYIRAFRAWPLYPLMLIFDIDFVVTALIKVLSYAKTPTNNDDINFINCILQAEHSMPTPWSKLAKWIYRYRPYPINSGTATNPAQACLNSYFRGTNPGPKLEVIYEPLTKHYFG